MSEIQRVVTIDGPSGVGKSTISRRMAAGIGFTYLDTGAMYRGVAWYLEQNGVDLDDEVALTRALEEINLQLVPASDQDQDVGVLVNGEDVSGLIRTPEMGMLASQASALAPVRQKLTEMQRLIGQAGGIVAEGRDTGTVVYPGAFCKFYLEAAPEVRARRRVLQLREQGGAVDEQELLAMIIRRDQDDQKRTLAPLKRAPDAVLIETGALDIDGVCEAMFKILHQRLTELS